MYNLQVSTVAKLLAEVPLTNVVQPSPMSQQGHKSTLQLCAFCTTGIVGNNKM